MVKKSALVDLWTRETTGIALRVLRDLEMAECPKDAILDMAAETIASGAEAEAIFAELRRQGFKLPDPKAGG